MQEARERRAKREGIDELILQRIRYLIKTEHLVKDPVLVLARRVEVLTWVLAATAVTQVTLRIL